MTTIANGRAVIHFGDCLNVMPQIPDNSIDLICTDPPYFRVKGEWWDRQWDTTDGFIAWIGRLCEQWQRILRPNGSLYVFASPKMAARVEVEVGRWFNVLNRITWAKHDGTQNKGGLWSRADKDILRRFFEQKEEIIFAEQTGSDNRAKGESGYMAECDNLRGFVFEPLRAYLDGERRQAGVTGKQIQDWFALRGFPKYVTARHSFSTSQWELPTAENYDRLRQCFSDLGGGDYLRREYEDLRRPFFASPDAPYTDVWTFPTVGTYPGKHPCEKPLPLIQHIIRTSSRPDAVVFDSFMGSGQTGVAALIEKRRFEGVEIEQRWFDRSAERISQTAGEWAGTTLEAAQLIDLPLFAGLEPKP